MRRIRRVTSLTVAWLVVHPAVAGNVCPPAPNPMGYCELEIDRATLMEVDGDHDGFPDNSGSCGDFSNFTVTIVEDETTLTWPAQADGIADVVTGFVSDLTTDAGFYRAQCLVNGEPETSFWDSRTDPESGEAYYYLSRMQNNCGSSGFGESSAGVGARVVLEATGPCL